MLKPHYLAPIQDYTTMAFRLLVQGYGAKAALVPLVSATAIARNEKALRQIDASEKERFLGVQLFGSIPKDFAIAAKAIAERFPYVRWIDVNAGCPFPNVAGSGGGAALLSKPKLISKIISALRKCDFPVSVKMRLAENMDKTLAFVDGTQQADFLIVHGRTVRQHYSGNADWNAIKKIRGKSRIPIVGNGDIKTLLQGKTLVKRDYCDSFMIGRAALSNPLIFKGMETKTPEEKRRIFFEYLSLAQKHSKPELQDLKLKSFEFFKNFEGGAKLRGEISRAKSMDELVDLVGEI